MSKGFSFPFHVGNYSSDRRIADNWESIMHGYFIEENKGTMTHSYELSTEKAVYHDVDSYQGLLTFWRACNKQGVLYG